MRLGALALASLLATGAAAHAASDDADRLAAAQDLLRVSKQEKLQDVRIDLVVDRAKIQFKQTFANASDADVAEYAGVLREELHRDVAKLNDLRAHYYAEHFSTADLRAWTAMMNSDIGQKLIDAEPGLMRDLSDVNYLWLANAMQRTQARLQAAHANGATHL